MPKLSKFVEEGRFLHLTRRSIYLHQNLKHKVGFIKTKFFSLKQICVKSVSRKLHTKYTTVRHSVEDHKQLSQHKYK